MRTRSNPVARFPWRHANVSLWLGAVLALGSGVLGCEERARTQNTLEPSSSEPSPNASILPAPLTSAAQRSNALLSDAGEEAASADAEPPSPTPFPDGTETLGDPILSRELVGLTMTAAFHWHDPPKTEGPGASRSTVDQARSATELSLRIDLAQIGRMRLVFDSPAFLLPASTQLRSRLDHVGHLLVWPDTGAYRVLVPGTVRALLEERRADQYPPLEIEATPRDPGKYLGLDTQRIEIVTALGTLDLEQTRSQGLGGSGVLLCRFLTELISAKADSGICTGDWLPLRADYRWASRGRLGFSVTSLTRRQDLDAETLRCPPAGAARRTGELPASQSSLLVEKPVLAALKQRAEAPAQTADGGIARGLRLINRTDTPRYVLLDTVPVVWVPARGTVHLEELRSGSYTMQSRDFLGTAIDAAEVVTVPGQATFGAKPSSDDVN